MPNREGSSIFDRFDFKDWSRSDWLGTIFVGLVIDPPLGFVVALIWLAYEAWLTLRRMAVGVRQMFRDFSNAIGRYRQELAFRIKKQFTARPRKPRPPPTSAELAAAAKQRYEQHLRILAAAKLDALELSAASEKAKQQYLKELDALLK